MVRGRWLAWVAVVALAGFGRPVWAGVTRPDLTGEWRLDPQHSDMPQRPHGGGGWGGPSEGGWGRHGGGGYGGGGGGWSHHDGSGREPGGEAGASGGPEHRPVRLPDLMHIAMTPTLVSVADSTGAVLEEIVTVSAEADTLAYAPGAQHIAGQWKGDKLVIEREGPRGKVTETLSLEDKGATLVIKAKIESNGEMPPREFKHVYRKVAQAG